MKKTIQYVLLLVGLFLFGLTSAVQAQEEGIKCWTDEYNAQQKNDPTYIKLLEDYAKKIQQNPFKSNSQINCTAANSITIPVAVHFAGVVTCADAACLLAATEAQIQVLNEDFAAINADISVYNNLTAVCPSDYPAGTLANNGTCLDFCLATTEHPAGSGLEEGDPAITVGQHTWPSAGAAWSGYLNIFVSDEAAAGLGTGVLGVSPLVGAANGDGFYVLPSSFGGPGVSCMSGTGINTSGVYNLGRTATHELGHYLGLNHVFAGGTCASDGDSNPVVPGAPTVNDTSPQDAPNFGCPANVTSCATAPTHCGSPDMFTSFMDYGNDACLVMFTEDQAQVMNYIATQVIPFDTDGSKCAMASNSTVDACGIEPVCEQVGGVVFNDANEDGCQNVSENGIPSVTLELFVCNPDGSTTSLGTETTAPDGSYTFGSTTAGDPLCLDPMSTYQVQMNLPANYTNSTGAGTGCDGDNDDSPMNDGLSICYNPSDSDATDNDDDEHINFGILEVIAVAACPTVTPVNGTGMACASAIGTLVTDWQATLGADFMDPDGANAPNAGLQYSSVAIGDATFPQAAPTGTYAGDGCANDVQTWYAYYDCDSNLDGTADSYVDAGNFALTIYAEPQAPTIVANDAICNYSLSFACIGDTEGSTSVDGSTEMPSFGGNPTESVEVTTANGCTAMFTVLKPACSCTNCGADGGQF